MTSQEKKELLFGGIAALIVMALAILAIITIAIEGGWSFPVIALALAVIWVAGAMTEVYLKKFREERNKKRRLIK